MMKSIRQLACLAVMAAIGFLSTSAPAHAAFKLTLDDGIAADFKTITDNGAGDVNPLTGALTAIYHIGTFDVNVTTGVSKPILGGSTGGVMDLNSVDVSTSGSGTLKITLTDTGFAPLGAGTLTNSVGGTLSGNGTATAQAWKDPLNQEFGLGAGTFTPGLQSLTGPAFSSTASVADNVTTPYSMTIRFTITANGGLVTFSADDELKNTAVVPELDSGSMASGLTLVSGSLLMLFGRRRLACA